MPGKIKHTGKDLAFDIINNIFLFFCLVVIALPLLNVVSQSISNPLSVLNGKVFLLPVKPTLRAYEHIIRNSSLISSFLNSVFYAVFGTVISVSLTIMAAYPLSRKSLAGRGIIQFIFVFTMLFSGGMIPTYLIVQGLGLIDTRWALLLPNAVGVWFVIVARTFFQSTVPVELYDSAEIDGAGDLRTFFKIVLPLSIPIVAVLVLFYAVEIWNRYFEALIYLNSGDKYPLQLVLRNILKSSEMQSALIQASGKVPDEERMALTEVLKYAVIVFASIPVMVLYPFIQRHFTKGLLIGTLKG